MPAALPVATPVLLTVRMLVSLLPQVPPVVVLLSVWLLPKQMLPLPAIAATTGRPSTRIAK